MEPEADPDICGPKLTYQCISAHLFCLLFASDLRPRGTEREEQMTFLPKDIGRTAQLAAPMVCFVCGKRGATITCQEMGCDRRFHLPCAVQGGCVTRYLLPFSSFCWEHRPQQQELVAPEDTKCLICMDPVEGRTTYGTMVCPACKHAWFHRVCIQGQATHAGAFCLQCPLCQNIKLFLTEMLNMGIRIPIRQASWEDNNAYAELYQRHRSCDARECRCPGGRGVAEPDGPWQLLLCRSCAAVGAHRRCSKLGKSREVRWECDSCAGLGTSRNASSELAAPSTAGPAASGQSAGSLELELSSLSTSRQMPSAPWYTCPVCDGSSRSSNPGPDRRRHQTRCTRQTQTPYTWARRLQERSRRPATHTESNTRSHAVPRLSHCSPSRETHSHGTTRHQQSAASRSWAPLQRSRSNRSGGPMRVRDRSCLHHWAQAPYAQPRRHSQGRHTPAARAGRSPCRQAATRLSHRSPSRARHGHSTTRQRPSASLRVSRAEQRGSASRSTGPVRP
ncbi:G2/M phase-specific E3 ubiquitin-protein ligase-like [Lathamus discolor]|uniref:G2/M phase-specific E3 ubiquitin-protein ligase-like n=1 Tax=Lathamus discolor TaxID=678569 RepID=UPI0032B7A6D1